MSILIAHDIRQIAGDTTLQKKLRTKVKSSGRSGCIPNLPEPIARVTEASPFQNNPGLSCQIVKLRNDAKLTHKR